MASKMNDYKILSALILIILFGSCQSELMEQSQPKHKLTVNAYLPNDDETRAHLLYGYGDPDNRSKEILVWDHKDYIHIFNVTRLQECPWGIQLETTTPQINGNKAIFESIEGYDKSNNFNVKKGDVIFVNLGETLRKLVDSITFDERKIFTISLGSEANKPQYIEKNPDRDTTLSFMKDNLRMYDIVTAEEDGKLPDIHFKHLSAIMRVTLHNKTGNDLYPTQLQFIYPTKSPTALESDSVDHNPSFFNTTLYVSVEPDDNEGYKLKTYEEFYNGSAPYTERISTTINGKNGTEDAGESIPNGESYELYISTIPRIGNDSLGDTLYINLTKDHDTNHPYSIAISNFNTVIEAGKRYWFDLVATPDNKLVFKSQYNPDDYITSGSSGEENKEEGGETTPED